MANKCLQTKLKSVVNNSSLDVFNALVFTLPASTAGKSYYYMLKIQSGKTATAKIIAGNAHFNDQASVSHSEITVAGTTAFYVIQEDGGEVKWTIDNLYDIGLYYFVGSGQFDFKKWCLYSDNISCVDIPIGIGNIVKMEDLSIIPSSMVVFSIKNYHNLQRGTIQDLGKCTHATDININDGRVITGDISGLEDLTELTTLSLYGQSIEGSLDELAAAQVTNGRTSGTIKTLLGGGNSNVSFIENGETVYIHKFVYIYIDFDSSYSGGYRIRR